MCYTLGMKRVVWMMVMLVAGMLSAERAAEERAIREEKYGPMFYGIELPEQGANLLLVIDISKSMGRKDRLRTDGGRRWDTLVDEVTTMCGQMEALVREKRVHYAVTVLYEGGEGHLGTEAYPLAKPEASAQLLRALQRQAFAAGGSFETTFRERLWSLVARDHITHVIYLGDNDIGKYDELVRGAVGAWYALPRQKPSAEQRPLWNRKQAWQKGWAHWRKPAGRGQLTFKRQQSLPPPPKDVVFSCVAIGQASPTLKALAELGQGEYVERRAKRSR